MIYFPFILEEHCFLDIGFGGWQFFSFRTLKIYLFFLTLVRNLHLFGLLRCAHSLSAVWPLWPHGLQPASLLRPWDSPGKMLECAMLPCPPPGHPPNPGITPSSPAQENLPLEQGRPVWIEVPINIVRRCTLVGLSCPVSSVFQTFLYDVSWHGLLCVHSIWDPLSFSNL